MQERIEYWLVVAVARTLGRMPRGLARVWAWILAVKVYWLFGRLRRVGVRKPRNGPPGAFQPGQEEDSARGYLHLGWQLVEFCRMTRYTSENTRD